MSESKYPRGSEWRKWDLQVHTPFSALNNGFGSNSEEYTKILFRRALEKNIVAIGVTDYFSIEGYKKLKELQGNHGKLQSVIGEELATQAQHILLLPNIELRTSVIIKRPDGTDSRVNFHVIFSDEVEIDAIEEHFFRELKFTAQANPGNPDERWSLTLENLQALGKKLKEQHEQFRDRSDLQIGMMNAVVTHEDVTEVLERQSSRFKDRFLIVVPSDEDLSKCSWDGQGHLTRKLLIQKSHMLFSGNPGTREFGLGKKHPTGQDFVNEFKGLKPCVHGSDSHTYESLFEPAENRHTWIKADPTFQGLRHLIYEPESRVFIGDFPSSMTQIEQNATKYISSVGFTKAEQAPQEENWFGGQIPLNHGLVAVIGNKGSGKSALADILALVGDTHAGEHFSFLTRERFLDPKARLGTMFQATVMWKSGREVTRRLNGQPDHTIPELVKYIPQNYLETICTELKESQDTQFNRELMEVIYSHVGDADRLGKGSLQELVAYLTNETEERIKQLAGELTELNAKIVSLEEQTAPEYRSGLQAQLEQRRAELNAHDKAKPVEVLQPEQDPTAQADATAINTELSNIQGVIAEVEPQLAEARAKDQQATARIAAARKLLSRIENLERGYEKFLRDSAEDGNTLELELKQIVTLNVDRSSIEETLTKAEDERESARIALDPESGGSVAARLAALQDQAKEQRAKLDEPNRRYQNYLQALREWEEKRCIIEGTAESGDSVKGLENRLSALDQLPGEIKQLEAKRTNLTREVFGAKEKLLAKYRELYAPVQHFIEQHPISKQHGALQFRATVAVEGIEKGLLRMIHQGRTGSFYGEKEGQERLRDLAKAADFLSADGTLQFVEQVLDYLRHDRRESAGRVVHLSNQLRQDFKPTNIYDFLFGLDYLRPRFELRWQDKPLDQLSPGERGNLLLVFYLLIDKRDVPLIIDQPEENLDNQTIASMLVPAIKEAKERRQIIMVTHNPNLAVVCDADQVIHARLDKTDGNRVVYTSGSIENPEITQLIVDILEGTKPAFDLRDAKYEILERVR
jgi:predicted ATPase